MPSKASSWRAPRSRPDLRRFERAVDELAGLLGAGLYITAREICRFQECTTAAARRRIRALEARGHKIETVRKRLGARGPLSIGYTIAGAL